MTAADAAGLAVAGPLAGNGAEALHIALAEIAAGAEARDAAHEPRFPDDAFSLLDNAGVLAFNAIPGEARPAAATELALVRQVAAADGSVGRIFDGHLNAIERLAVQAPVDLRDRELAAVQAGALLAGVWGGDPVGDEGPAATVTGSVLRGVKTFCSGAGGLDRAAVLARAEHGGPPLLVWINVADRDHVEVDPGWYRARGLVASVSHRVVFHDAPVLARLGGQGWISEQPWFGRDALRTAASWAGMADSACSAALATLAERAGRGELEGLAAGRILTARSTIDVWLEHAAAAMHRSAPELGIVALRARAAIAAACRALLDEAARACGSRPFARAQALDRARRDLELFLLQHRLDPLLARHGTALLDDLANDGSTGGGRWAT